MMGRAGKTWYATGQPNSPSEVRGVIQRDIGPNLARAIAVVQHTSPPAGNLPHAIADLGKNPRPLWFLGPKPRHRVLFQSYFLDFLIPLYSFAVLDTECRLRVETSCKKIG